MLDIGSDAYLDSPHFSPRERAAILWAEHMAKNTARVRDDVFAEVKRHFSDAELVELTGICGYFGSTNRFQDSMRLPIEEQDEVDKISRPGIQVNVERLKAYVEHLVKNWPSEFPEPPRDASAAPAGGATPSKVSGTEAPPAALPPRVALLHPESARGETALYFQAARLLFDGVPNAVRIWANSPYVFKLCLPWQVAAHREGAGSILATKLKTMVRIRVSHLNAAPYSLAHATALGRTAGITEDQIAALSTAECVNSPHFPARERAALFWAEHVVPNTAKRRDDSFEGLKKHFSDAEIVELTALCSMSTMVDLIQNALRVPLEAPDEIERINRSPRLDPQRLKAYLEMLLANWPREFPAPAR